MVLAGTDLRLLERDLAGSLLRPGDAGYAPAARTAVAGRLREALPRAVVRCTGPGDVARAVAFARDQGLPMALRSSGHSFADHSSTSGLLIDLGPMASIELDRDSGVATVGPGARIGALAERLAGHGRMVSCGWWPTVAVAGAVLGGGFGRLGRLYGLGTDHLVAAQVVTADGRVRRVDDQHDPDLLWALRGAGGGSFAAVTSLALRTHPAVRTTTFACLWRYRHAARAVRCWQDWAPVLPAHVTAELVLAAPRDLRASTYVALFGSVAGPRAEARRLLAEFGAAVGQRGDVVELSELPGRDAARRYTYAGLPADERPAAGPPLGRRPAFRIVKSDFFDRPLPAAAVDELVAGFARDRAPGQYRELELVPWGGAYARVAPGATAFVHRTARFLIEHTVKVGPEAGDRERRAARRWAANQWATVHPFGNGHVYQNYPDPDLDGWAHAYYGGNLARLRRVKRAYDPMDVFHFEQSVPPG